MQHNVPSRGWNPDYLIQSQRSNIEATVPPLSNTPKVLKNLIQKFPGG